jgi:hypothetical protein
VSPSGPQLSFENLIVMAFSTLGEPSMVSAAVNAEIMVLWNASLVVGYVLYVTVITQESAPRLIFRRET